RRVVTVSADNTVKVWDATTGAQVASFPATNTYGAVLNGEGSRVLIWGNTVRILDVATGKIVGMTPSDQRPIGASSDSNGWRVLFASSDGSIGVQHIPATTDELVKLSKRAVPRCLTLQQREDAFLEVRPPAWCVEMERWPYDKGD